MISRFSFSAAVVAVSAVAIAAPAMAQDQGSPWHGWYVGANIGANWGNTDLSSHATVPSTGGGAVVITPADAALIHSASSGGNKTGFTGGVEGGYNWRYDYWLLGIETDYQALNNDTTLSNSYQSTGPVINPPGVPVTYSLHQRATTSWMWSLRPRVGVVYGSWLFYGTGGVAVTDVKLTTSLSDNRSTADALNISDNATKTGWIAGLGAGYAITPNWSVKGEWLYADFGGLSTTSVSPSGYAALTSSATARSNLLRVGLDYRF